MSCTPPKRSFADQGVPKLELGHEEQTDDGREMGNGVSAKRDGWFSPEALECADSSALCGRRQLAAVGGVDLRVRWERVRHGAPPREETVAPRATRLVESAPCFTPLRLRLP